MEWRNVLSEEIGDTFVWDFLDFVNSCYLVALHPNMLKLAKTTIF